MPHLTAFPEAILETVLTGLIELFLAGANGDKTAARHAASDMLAGHHPRTEDELRLAATIIGFSFQALKALGQAAPPDIPLARALRLNGSAVSLSRESAKAERRLAQLQKEPKLAKVPQLQEAPQQAIRTPMAEIQPEPEAIQTKIETSPVVVQHAGKILSIAKANGITWTQAYKMHQRDLRIAAKRADGRIPDGRDHDQSSPVNPPQEHQHTEQTAL